MNEQKPLQEQKPHYAPPVYAPYYEDEISLVDLWLVLVKRKKLILQVMAGFLLLAVALVFIKKDNFDYSTSIEIGQIVTGTNGAEKYELIEPVDSVKAKLENSYLPAAQAQYYQENPDASVFKISVEAPKNAQMLIVKSKGKEHRAERHKTIHEMALNPLLKDLNRKVESYRKSIEIKLASANLVLSQLKDPVTLSLLGRDFDSKIEKEMDSQKRLTSDIFWIPEIKKLESEITQAKSHLLNSKNKEKALVEQKQRLNELEKLLLKQFDELDAQIKESHEARKKAINSANDSATAMTLLLLDSETERLVTRRAKLEERIYIEHRNKIVELENEIAANQNQQKAQSLSIIEAEAQLEKSKADRSSQIVLQQPRVDVIKDQKNQALLEHQRKIVNQQNEINSLQAVMDSVTESRVIVPFLQSLQPQGLTSKVLFVLVLFLGFIFAIISAFVAEFMLKVREKMKEEGIV